MRIRQTGVAGAVLLVPQPFRDERGLFTRTFDADIFDDFLDTPGFSASFLQDSQSRSIQGAIRGMHGRSGQGEAKLVRCANGAVHDVIVDIRPDSPTFGYQLSVRLDDADFLHLYVPQGFLHGFQALTPTADVCYRINRPHDPSEDLAVAFDDAELDIAWPLPATAVSARDRSAGSWRQLVSQLGLPETSPRRARPIDAGPSDASTA
ncbi:dTDP-4-dehydrorhamnose 3,5-epimerase family protein [Mycolicibacterium sphagni]|uniref:dTDP-4-dehydrorhamnose 3,5-epimerase n=1 Tax=Mycolicibacterium sphagni TaxID=1786 RepID=A0A255DKM3_9MYCO|nr:dTDP-4-dehydrorhamnose 3,5-epimerase [Mycolicibacterium sphagni]MCV7178485.1 dTDP-4-dehydrorhamnose 3,5-epimerase family protein [Mycolicibacterium sphagni]OYN79948.1 dTDP-4-dehydrorhamnose 3,5-epimerase [Mycolicibacterium sphagni]